MKILAIDVGTGTQDILIYDDEKELENSIKLVLPSPHLYISQQIKEIERKRIKEYAIRKPSAKYFEGIKKKYS